MVIAAVSTVVAAFAFAIALLRDPPSDPAEGADVQQVGAEVAAARAESDEAVATADAAMFVAEEAAARAARVEEALAAALAEPGETVAPDVIARIEAQLDEVRDLAAAALVAADASSSAGDPPVAGDETADDGSAGSEEEPVPEEEPAPGSGDASGEEPMAEDDGEEPASGSGDASGEEPASGSGDASGEEPMAEDDEAADLPGEPYEFGPPAGAELAVVGVSHDSVLNVRDMPAGEIVARLDNVMNAGSEPVVYVRQPGSDELIATLDLNRGLIATGNTRKLPTTIWHEIRMADAVGWASSAFLSPLGATSDATAEIVAVLGETPTAPTLAELARAVADAVASNEPPSRIVVSGAPVTGDLGEITVDVLGLPDDAVRGFRLHILAHQDSDSDPFALRTVESTTICDSHRGVSEEGLCN